MKFFDFGAQRGLALLRPIEQTENGLFIADPLFELWFKREMK